MCFPQGDRLQKADQMGLGTGIINCSRTGQLLQLFIELAETKRVDGICHSGDDYIGAGQPKHPFEPVEGHRLTQVIGSVATHPECIVIE